MPCELSQTMLVGKRQKHFLILVAFLLPELTFSYNAANFLKKTCTDVGTYRVIFGISIETCGDECQRRKRCSAIMYHPALNECKLKDFVNRSLLTEGEPICELVSKTGLVRQSLHQCSEHDCGETDRCETALSNQKGFKCIATECPRPHKIPNAELLSNMHAVGYKTGYKCDTGYVGVGDPFITCTNRGTWTPTTFTCNLRGRQPKTTFENGELTSVVGEKWIQGTVIHFQCRSGFQGRGTNATSMINSKGQWTPRVVQCCNDNSTDIWEDSCIERVNGSALGNRSEMIKYCTKRGGKIGRLDPNDAKSIFESGGYQWIMHNKLKPDFEKEKNLTVCLADNMVNDSSDYTYSKMVRLVVDRNFKGKHCQTARWWAPGQPGGGPDENCIVFSRDDDFKMHDAPCSLNITDREHIGFVCTYYSLPQI